MQVSEAAAIDVGGGNRFDAAQNREIGRAYLALLYHRYGEWPDAIAAYNWGIGNLDAWVRAGRPLDGSRSGCRVLFGPRLARQRRMRGRLLDNDATNKGGPTLPTAPRSAPGRKP